MRRAVQEHGQLCQKQGERGINLTGFIGQVLCRESPLLLACPCYRSADSLHTTRLGRIASQVPATASKNGFPENIEANGFANLGFDPLPACRGQAERVRRKGAEWLVPVGDRRALRGYHGSTWPVRVRVVFDYG